MNQKNIVGSVKYLLWLVAACACPLAVAAQAQRTSSAPTRKYLPHKFKLALIAFEGGSIEWKGNTLYYHIGGWESPTPKMKTVAPSPQAWKRFWKQMDAIQLWRWRTEYALPTSVGMADGEGWKIEIEQQGKNAKKCSASGYNSYPSDSDVTKPTVYKANQQPGRSQVFNRYLAAVNSLLHNVK